MGKTLVTGATGLLGSHLVRALAARGDDLRLLIRRESDVSALDGIEFERVTGDVTDRRSVRRAVEGASRVFHVAGKTSLRHRRPRPDVRRQRRRHVAGRPGVAGGRRRAARLHLLGRRDRPGAGGRQGRRDPALHGRAARDRLRQLQARGRGRGAPGGRAGPRRGDRQPDVRARSVGRQHDLALDRADQEVPPAPDPRLRRRRPQRRRRPRRRHRPPARRGLRPEGRALHPRRPQLHDAAPLRGPLADQRRPGPDAEAAAAGRRPRARGCRSSCTCGSASRPTRPAPPRSGGRTRRRRRSGSSASSPARTRRRSRRRWR